MRARNKLPGKRIRCISRVHAMSDSDYYMFKAMNQFAICAGYSPEKNYPSIWQLTMSLAEIDDWSRNKRRQFKIVLLKYKRRCYAQYGSYQIRLYNEWYAHDKWVVRVLPIFSFLGVLLCNWTHAKIKRPKSYIIIL